METEKWKLTGRFAWTRKSKVMARALMICSTLEAFILAQELNSSDLSVLEEMQRLISDLSRNPVMPVEARLRMAFKTQFIHEILAFSHEEITEPYSLLVPQLQQQAQQQR